MKIYEIGTGYTPIPAKVAAATESVVEELTKAFVAINQPVEILDISTSNRGEHNLPITEVKVPSAFTGSDVSLGVMHKVKRVVYSVALALSLRKILKNEPEKVVLHFHNQYNLFFFLKLTSSKIRSKVLIAYTNHNGLWSLPWKDAEGVLHKKYFQEIYAIKKSDIVFVLNKNTGDSIKKHLNVEPEKVVQINNGVNTDIYRPLSCEEIREIKESLGLADKKIILQVGSINENKGQVRTVELIAPLLKNDSGVVFAYAGDIVSKEYYEKIQNTAKELGVNEQVVYLGAVSPGYEMNKLYNVACMTVFASKYESFGLVCIESLSAGVPVLLCSEALLDFGDGCVRCNNENFTERITDILAPCAAECCMSTPARENALANYSWKKIAQDYIKALDTGNNVE